MRRLLASICAAVALSVPAVALTAANASAATSRPAERPAVTAPLPAFGGHFYCHVYPQRWAFCHNFYFPRGTRLWIEVYSNSVEPVDIAVIYWFHDDTGWHKIFFKNRAGQWVQVDYRYGLYEANGLVPFVKNNTNPVIGAVTAQIYVELSSSHSEDGFFIGNAVFQ